MTARQYPGRAARRIVARTLTTAFAFAGVAIAGCSHGNRDASADGRSDDGSSTARAVQPGVASTPGIKQVGKLETVATFDGAMPTGVTVSKTGRVFVNFPRWGDTVPYTVGEVKAGSVVAYPNEAINRYAVDAVSRNLVSVQSVVVDPRDRLWLLDTGSINFGPVVDGGPKLVGVDLNTNQVFNTIHFPPDVALKTTYLNDIRFDLRRGNGGYAYITDSGNGGPNGIIVVDLDSGQSWRKLTGHSSVKADADASLVVEGQPLKQRPVPGVSMTPMIGSDGIAISPDGSRLFYTPLIGRKLYSVSTDALADPNATDEQVAQTVVDHGDRGYASDGLESDAAGNLYLTDFEHNAVHRRKITGSTLGADEVLVQGPTLIWPDTLSVAHDGFLYITANQLNRQKDYNEGKDLRQKPYLLLRTKIDGKPVALTK